MSDNIDTMMYVNIEPWHKKGKRLEKVATAKEAIEVSGLNWNVKKEKIFLKNDTVINNKFAIVREDRNIPLGVVGSTYSPLQNDEAFSFFDAIIGIKAAVYHTAGSLGNGERIWLLAKLPKEVRVKNQDLVEQYLLLSNSHNGTSCISVQFTPIRVVCQNTLNMAMQSGKKFNIRHSSQMLLKVRDAQKQLGIINQMTDIFEQATNKMADKKFSNKEFKNYIYEVFNIKDNEDISTYNKNMISKVSELFDGGKGNHIKDIQHTAWTAYNSVVEYIDYYRRPNQNENKRITSMLFGSGYAVKERAFSLALSK